MTLLPTIDFADPTDGEKAKLGAGRIRALAEATHVRFAAILEDQDADIPVLKGEALGLYPLRAGEVGAVNLHYPFGHIQRYSAAVVGAGVGAVNDQAALQLAITAVQNYSANGGEVLLPERVRLVNAGVVISSYGITIRGVARRATRITLAPTVNGVIFFDIINANPLITIENFFFKNCTITCDAANTMQKIAVRVTDGSACHFEDFAVNPLTTSGAANANPSIGIQFRGRELSTFKRCFLYADIPFDVQPNPRITGSPTPISLDGCSFEDFVTCALGSAMPNIRIGASCGVVDNTKWTTWIALQGKYALYWDDPACLIDTICLKIDNFRWEQATDATGCNFWIHRNAFLHYQFIVDCGSLGQTSDGFNLQRVGYVSYSNGQFANSTGKFLFVVDGTVQSVLKWNVWENIGAGNSFAGTHSKVFGAGKYVFVTAQHTAIEYWEADVTGIKTGIFDVGNKLRMLAALGHVISGSTEWGVENSGITRTNFRVADSGADMQLSDGSGTKDFRVFLEAVLNEIAAGTNLVSSAGNISMIPARSSAAAGFTAAIGYFDTIAGLCRAALEITNSAGLGTLKLMKSGGRVTNGGGYAGTATNAVFGASVPTDAATSGERVIVTPTSGIAFAMSSPTNGISGQRITFTIKNTTGGALGAVAWGALFKIDAWVNPANGFSRSICFEYDGANWIQLWRGQNDVPN